MCFAAGVPQYTYRLLKRVSRDSIRQRLHFLQLWHMKWTLHLSVYCFMSGSSRAYSRRG